MTIIRRILAIIVFLVGAFIFGISREIGLTGALPTFVISGIVLYLVFRLWYGTKDGYWRNKIPTRYVKVTRKRN